MIKYKNNISKNKTFKVKEGNYNFFSLKSSSYSITKMLENYWDIYLAADLDILYDAYICKNQISLYFLGIHISPKLNYLVLAKTIDLLSSNNKLPHKIKEFQKTVFNNIGKNCFISHWLSFLCLEQFSQYMKSYTKYMTKLRFFNEWNNNQFQWFENFLIFGHKDFLLLKEYRDANQIWQFSMNIINKNQLIHQLLQFNNKSNSIFCLHHEIKFTKKYFLNKKNNQIYFDNLIQIETRLNRLAEYKYNRLIKNIINYNKMNTQGNLIKKNNIIRKYWNDSSDIILIKKNFNALNYLLDKTFLKWTIFRHIAKSLRWTKNRYWYKFEDGTYFCQC